MKLIPSKEIENVLCEEVQENEVKEIIEVTAPEIILFIKDLNKKIMKQGYGCHGLAAIQLGIFKKFFVRYYGQQNKEDVFDIIFNAWYVNYNSSRFQNKEGCFSYDLGKKIAIVKRWKKIIMFHDEWDYKNNKFKRRQKRKLMGVDAVVVQHEIQHHGNGKGVLSQTIFTQGKEKDK